MKSPNADKNNLILVYWQDSKQPMPEWSFTNDLPHLKIAEAETVGFLVAENEEIIMLAQSIANANQEDEQACGLMQIPKRCIVSHILLGEAGEK